MKTLLRSTTAYRTYREDAARGNVSHTTLVLFPDEIYLRALLKECAKAFFGSERAETLIEKESFSDCRIYPEEGGKLNADMCAEIVDESMLRPVEGEKKLFVLLFRDATPLVQNKLLKSLEEPPEGVYFLLGASSEYTVLPTVLSRAKKIAEPPFPEGDILAALRRVHPGAKEAAACAAACGGIFSTAEALLSDAGDFALAEAFLSGGEEQICREIEKRKEKKPFFAALKLVLRDALFCATGNAAYCVRTPAACAATLPAGVLLSALDAVGEAEKQLMFNANAGQALYAVALQIRKEKQRWKSSS